MDFKRYLDKAVVELDREVEKITEEELRKATKTDKKLTPLIKAFVLACQGGKRIRGALVKLGYEIGKKQSSVHPPTAGTGRQSSERKQEESLIADSEAILKAESSIIKIGAAIEIVHTAILIHDDIIDKSLTRRGKPSLYAALGGDHYGVSQAISLADYGFFLSYKIICETDFPDKLKIKALNFFSQVMMNTGWGEMLDLEETNPLTVMKLKTACYTIAGPLALGAILGGLGLTSPRLRRIKEFGENLGVAYQIQDDILDLEIRSAEEGRDEVLKFTDKAMKVLPAITKDKTMSKLLQQMAEYLVQRTK